jgi:hypothetical protein
MPFQPEAFSSIGAPQKERDKTERKIIKIFLDNFASFGNIAASNDNIDNLWTLEL